MDILFITRRFYPEIKGGGEVSAFHIVKNIQSLGHTVNVVTLSDEKDAIELIDGIPVERIKFKPFKYSSYYSNLNWLWNQIADRFMEPIKRYDPDIIHVLNFECIPITVTKIKKQFPNIPIVAGCNGPNFGCVTLNGIHRDGSVCCGCNQPLNDCIGHWGLLKGFGYYLYSLWYMPMLKRSYKSIDKFFCVSKAIAAMLKTMDVPDSKIDIIHNPVRPHEMQNIVHKGTGYSIVYAGRLHPNKGVDKIIKVLPSLPNATAIIAGIGPAEQSLKELSKTLKVDNRVQFLGFVDPLKMNTVYSHATVVVLPCTVYESLSRMLLEACSFGIPVIATDVGGNKEVVEHDVNGMLLKGNTTEELVNAIRYVLVNEERMSKAAKDKIRKEFNPTAIALRMIENYTALKKT